MPYWREQAERLQRYGASEAAATLSTNANELEAALRASRDEPMSLGDAAIESGLSADHLGRLVRAGKIPNAGRKGAPRIRRGDLPRKAADDAARRLQDGARVGTVAQVRADLARGVATS